MVSLNVTPEPGHWPPRVRLDFDTEVSSQTFTAIRVRRNGTLLREQPYAGGETALVYDYEAPFGVPLTYTAEVDYADMAVRRDETWANLTGWTSSGTTAVNAGRLRLTGAASVQRAVAYDNPSELVIHDPYQWEGPELLYGYLRIDPIMGGLRFDYGDSADSAIIPNDSEGGPTTFSMTDSQVTASIDDTTVTLGRGLTLHYAGLRAFQTGGGVAHLGAFTLRGGAAVADVLSATTTLAVTAAWLINPVAPALSMPVDSGDCSRDDDYLSIVWPSGSRKESAAARNVWNPVGRRRAVVITTGPRYDYDWNLVVKAPTIEHESALMDLLRNQSPLLLLLPAGVRWDLDEGWYSVGDVSVDRDENAPVDEATYFTLPLKATDPPAVAQGAIRTWGDLLGEAATWADVLELYPTWTDVLAGP